MSNTVSATHIFDGIELCSNSNRVHDNVVNGSAESAIHLDSSCGKVMNNRVSDNTINGACAGILVGTAAGHNSIDDNTLFNVQNRVLSADQCSPSLLTALAASSAATATKNSKYSPARP
jgi:parallel beta-helix repeat protein